MPMLELTKGYQAIIDEEQVESASLYKWHANITSHDRVYARTVDPIGPGRWLYLHRHIARAPDGVQVDHRNGHTLDCRLDNLRWATNRQNSANQRKRKGTSKYKGVHWSRKIKTWVASIHADYDTQFLGHFKTEEDAARAYDAAAVHCFGTFARTNFTCQRRPLIQPSDPQIITG